MGVRLPAEYQEVEYVNSGENSVYIDVDFIPDQNTRYLLRASNNGWQFQFRENNRAGYKDGTEFGFIYTSNSKYSSRFGPATLHDIAGTKFSTDDIVVVDKNKNDLLATNGVRSVHILSSKVSFSANKSMVIPGSNTENGKVGKLNANVYQATIWDNDTLIHDFVPCYRKSDSKPGMYDLVSKTFFTNAGTGEFLVGPDVIDSISPLMVAWRRIMMQQEPELYPVGTEILGEYIGRDGIKLLLANQHRLNDSTGAYESYTYAAASDVYVPINPKYTYYRSGGGQIVRLWYYDKNKNPISRTSAYNSTTSTTITNIPTNAKYIRVQSNTNSNQWAFEITRTA